MRITPTPILQSVVRMRPAGAPTITPAPAAELDFATGNYRLGGNPAAFAGLVSFTRASAASYVDSGGSLISAAADQPRFDHDPATGAPLGLLIEPASTNLILRSQDFSIFPWSNSGSLLTITEDDATAPDGTATATRLVPNTGTGLHRVYQPWVPVNGMAYTVSIFMKDYGSRYAYINGDAALGVRLAVDLQTGAYVTGGASASNPVVEAWPNGWWRVAITGVGTSNTGNGVWVQLNSTLQAVDQNFAGNGVDGIRLWGALLEEGPVATSYIATGSSTATRTADQPGLMTMSGNHDVKLTYDDMSTETLAAQSISPGWWPGQARPRLRRMVIG